ncbi:MAG TPA: GxxExxY protein [Terriglobales bacterium]|nr:GxxExxY protein [Terriglobales bacterium]
MATVATQAKRSANAVSKLIVDGAMKVHTALGPGLLESTYAACLAQELRNQGLEVRTEVPLPVFYEGLKLEIGYRIDMLVGDVVVVEVKSIDAIAPIHQAQLLSYLKLSGRGLGLLLNFNVVHLKDGIRRFVLGSSWQ